MRKRIIAIIVLVFSIFSMLSAAVSGTEPRSFSFSLKRDYVDPFKILFVNRNSTEQQLIQIDSAVLNLSKTPELTYYMVFVVKPKIASYMVNITISPFMSKNQNLLPSAVEIFSNELNKVLDTEKAENGSVSCRFTQKLGSSNGQKPTYYFYGFFYSFPDSSAYIPGEYSSTVTVEVSTVE